MHCVVQENYVRIIFKHYTPGVAPALLINHTTINTINYWQRYLMGGLLVHWPLMGGLLVHWPLMGGLLVHWPLMAGLLVH